MSAMLTVRTDEHLKREVGATLRKLRLNHTTAINMFYRAIQINHGLPFEVRIPNKATLDSMGELDEDGSTVYASPDDFFKEHDL